MEVYGCPLDTLYIHHTSLIFRVVSVECYHGALQAKVCIQTNEYKVPLTLTVLVVTIDAQWEGMGDVGSARYEPALLPPCPTIRV